MVLTQTPQDRQLRRAGNNRTSFITAVLMLELNGIVFTGDEVDAAVRTLALAAGEMTEPAFAAWLEANSKPS